MKKWNGPEGWTETWRDHEEPESTAMRVTSFIAALILISGICGLLFMGFPYILAMVSEYTVRRHTSNLNASSWLDEWIKNDTHSAAWARFAWGAVLSGTCLILWWLRASKEEKNERGGGE